MHRRTRALLLIPLLAGCGDVLPQVDLLPRVEERGECTLDRVSQWDGNGRRVELEAPYVVTMTRDEVEGTLVASFTLEGDGWRPPEGRGGSKPTVRIVKPDGRRTGTLSYLRGEPGESDVVSVDHTVNIPGVWTYIVEWELIDCRQVVSIEALPPE